MEIEEVEFDFQCKEENQFRPTLDLERVLDKRFFYGRAGLNITLGGTIFMKKEEADEIANDIEKAFMRLDVGDKMTALEKFAVNILKNSCL